MGECVGVLESGCQTDTLTEMVSSYEHLYRIFKQYSSGKYSLSKIYNIPIQKLGVCLGLVSSDLNDY